MPGPKDTTQQRVSDAVRDSAGKEAAEVLQGLGSTATGLSEEEAAARLEQHGPNEVASERQHSWLQRV